MWHFNSLIPGQKIRESVQDEFFAADVIRGAAEALIREGIQNSLDAAQDGQRVRVIIALRNLENGDGLRALQGFFRGAWEHFAAADNGLTDAPGPDDSCRFLVFEDFGTSGLTGDPDQLLPIAEIENRFFHFFRVEGRSDKHDNDRGRWGVGKQVFPRASRVKSVFGFTVRSEDKRHLIMGQAVLRSHLAGQTWYQDGWFGLRRGNDNPVFPVADNDTLETFQRVFGLTRQKETGLSLVVPYLLEEITEQEIIASVLRGYFYPILMGDLEVTIRAEASALDLNSENISAKVDELDKDLRAEIRPIVNLAIWSKNNKELLPELTPPNPEVAPQWSEDIVPENIREQVRENLRLQLPFGLRVPLMVRPRARGKPWRPSYFDIFLVRDDKETSGRPIFIREGIIISDVRGHRSRGVRSIVVIDRGALATMIGDSENPAHTQWQRDGSKFKDRYYYGGAYIRFIADSVSEIVRISTEAEDQEDISLLSDIFFISAEEGEEGIEEEEHGKKRDESKKVEPPPPPPDGSRTRFIVSAIDGGFSAKAGSDLSPLPALIRLRAAYDVRRGNPFSRYNSADFGLEKMEVKVSNATIMECSENRMILEVSDQDFGVTVRGFDPNRDVKVSIVRLADKQ